MKKIKNKKYISASALKSIYKYFYTYLSFLYYIKIYCRLNRCRRRSARESCIPSCITCGQYITSEQRLQSCPSKNTHTRKISTCTEYAPVYTSRVLSAKKSEKLNFVRSSATTTECG